MQKEWSFQPDCKKSAVSDDHALAAFSYLNRAVEFADFEMTYLDQIGPLLVPVSHLQTAA